MPGGVAVTGGFSQLISQDYKKVFFDEYKRTPYKFSQIFETLKADDAYIQEGELTGLQSLQELSEGVAIPFDTPIQGDDKTIYFNEFGLGFQVTLKMWEDDRTGHIKKMPAELGKAAQYHNELVAADVFNNGFVTTYRTAIDGKALFATDHTRQDGGTAIANEPSSGSDLSMTSLEAGVQHFKKLVNFRGIPIVSQPSILLIHPDEEWKARELLLSEYNPENANMAKNAAKDERLSYMCWPYLTDTDAWFLIDKQTADLRFYTRRAAQFKSGDDINTGNAIFTVTKRINATFFQWRGVYGNSGG